MKNKILSIALLSALSSTAMAGGFYGAIDLGQTTGKGPCSDVPAGDSCTDSDTAFRFGGGYQFTPNVGVEANYGILGSGKASGSETVGGVTYTDSIEAKFTTLQIAAIGTFPVANSFSLLGNLGIARTTQDLNWAYTAGSLSESGSDSKTDTNLAYGIGAQFDISKTIGVRAMYENLGESGDDVNTYKVKLSLLSAGVVFKF